MKDFKSGFIATVGLPNVGKSTLINKIIGQKVAIVSAKPQTTRNRIIAIRTTRESQLIFIDTPGIHNPRTKLGEYMVDVASDSIFEADVIFFVTSADREITSVEEEIIDKIKSSKLPAILVINKIDAVKKTDLPEQILKYNQLHQFEATVPISAKSGDGVKLLIEEAEKLLGEGPRFYPEDMVTDVNQRALAAEIIREKLLTLLDKEIPHGIAVEILQFKEEEKKISINANIYCEKYSHKSIIIGKGGEMLKRVGTSARIDLEDILEKKVFLELWVKPRDGWRNKAKELKNFGYDEKGI
ncbi:MAG: GTPase Era [Clostridia bacterium]|nr:GTPase Era [Clostridia bacterium]